MTSPPEKSLAVLRKNHRLLESLHGFLLIVLVYGFTVPAYYAPKPSLVEDHRRHVKEPNTMMTTLLPFFVALIGGIAGALQAPFAGMIGRALGDVESVLITYCGGAVVIILLAWLIKGGIHVEAWLDLPWYVFFSGPLGLLIVGSFSFAVPRLGVATATIVFVAAALTLGAIGDHFGLFGVPQRTLDPLRLLGIATFLIGIWLVR